jgi:hypothetical protein
VRVLDLGMECCSRRLPNAPAIACIIVASLTVGAYPSAYLTLGEVDVTTYGEKARIYQSKTVAMAFIPAAAVESILTSTPVDAGWRP